MSEANGNGTAIAPVDRKSNGQFQRGHKGYGGRKLGSRVKLSESFLADLHKAWLKRGAKALDEVAQKHPETFLRICATVLPKSMEFDGVLNVEAATFLEAYQRWGQHIGANPPPMIEAQVIADEAEPDEHA